ncbi:hypothetical protein SAY86_011686 [Trapa natans]|uniref:Casein kinase I n=1 Tax=Trapa natans TaxID=22666 RepID=A0AAN7LWX1_TRANT|nr:hypothetical protein SAY86_011686 [Trapa natans]
MDHVIGGKFKMGRKIGSGSFGELYLGVNVQNGGGDAIKLTKHPKLHYKSKLYMLLQGGRMKSEITTCSVIDIMRDQEIRMIEVVEIEEWDKLERQ